jgi:hypothetical protein
VDLADRTAAVVPAVWMLRVGGLAAAAEPMVAVVDEAVAAAAAVVARPV